MTVEANPETVTPELAALLRDGGVNRVSLGAQSFQPRPARVLERRAGPDDVRRAVYALRDAGFDNISLDLIYGIPGQSTADLEPDLDEALALEPEHLSCYELEAKPGTRFTHAHGDELARQAEAMEGYFERVVERLTGAGYRWYETANFCRPPDPRTGATSARGTTSPTGSAATTSASASAPSRRRQAAVANDAEPRRATWLRSRRARRRRARSKQLDEAVATSERVLLGLRLDEPLSLAGSRRALDPAALERLERLGLVERGAATEPSSR